jgi:hypothetical protein
MFRRRLRYLTLLLVTFRLTQAAEPQYSTGIEDRPLFGEPLDTAIPHVSTDPTVRVDYDIVYVRARRAGDEVHKRYFTDFSQPVTMEPGADLMLLHPDGSDELLVEGGNGSVTDPVISYDGEWVYYSLLYDLRSANQWDPPAAGADIFKLHLPTRRVVRLTNQAFTPNTGAANWSPDFRAHDDQRNGYSYGVFNMGPYPLPGGRIVFTSNRDGFRPPRGYPAIALQLFVMDDADTDVDQADPYPNSIQKIGHLNVAGALHPVVLRDGRIIFSTLESQGIRSEISWGIWSIHPDGTNWAPVISAFDPGGASNGFHFQTQLADGSMVIEEYYNQNNSGFGAYVKLPQTPPEGYAPFGPAWMHSERNVPWRFGRYYNGKGKFYRKPFMPTGSVSLTPFALNGEGPADPSIVDDEQSPRVGKFTHPSAAPEGHLLTVYSPGPVNHQYKFLPQYDGGIYVIPGGDVVTEPAQLRLIKNDPEYNESWPRAVVPYERVCGVSEPERLPELANDGSLSPRLPAGTPFGLVGSSSLYKRESYPNGVVPEGNVTAEYAGGNDPWKSLDAFTSHGNGMPLNWHNQGADVGLYENDEIHAIRLLSMMPTTDRRRGPKSGRLFYSHAQERLRILGEVPVRKFGPDGQPLDPDGNPDTSFLAKVPADTPFTFQTIDRNGLVLNMSQTWHQLRPGEIRNNCGGCHAHSQQPTDFALTAAAKPDYRIWDLVRSTPFVTDRARDESQRQWDADQATGLSLALRPGFTVEYHRDIQPILARSCAACHTSKNGKQPAAQLDLDADDEQVQYEHEGHFPGTYYRLAIDERAKFGVKPVGYDSWGYPNASRYIRKLQARRSLLVWKIFGRRLDGFSNDDHPSEPEPGAGRFVHRGEDIPTDRARAAYDLDFTGSLMPPPRAVESGQVQPLSDEDRRTIARWIDLGSPIDRDFDPAHPDSRGLGWMLDDQRPTLTVTQPRAGENSVLDRIVIGMHDQDTGLDEASFRVTSSIAIDGVPAGENLAARFQSTGDGVWEYRLREPVIASAAAVLDISVRDQEGNESRIVREMSARAPGR